MTIAVANTGSRNGTTGSANEANRFANELRRAEITNPNTHPFSNLPSAGDTIWNGQRYTRPPTQVEKTWIVRLDTEIKLQQADAPKLHSMIKARGQNIPQKVGRDFWRPQVITPQGMIDGLTRTRNDWQMVNKEYALTLESLSHKPGQAPLTAAEQQLVYRYLPVIR